jgi:predicted RNA-binding Zn-ribbon protein involved in translation (DUF1610 family)
MQEFPMPSYDSFMCPNCEHYFRVIWPDAMPSHRDPCSKIKMKCPDCGEVTELYDYLIDKIMQAPETGTPSVEVLSISPRDPHPNPGAPVLSGSNRFSFEGRQDSKRCMGIDWHLREHSLFRIA